MAGTEHSEAIHQGTDLTAEQSAHDGVEHIETAAGDAHADAAHHASFVTDEAGWVAIAFVAFVALFMWKVWPTLAKALDGRTEQIRNDLQDAAALKEEAQAILAEAQRKSAEAKKTYEEVLKDAKIEAKDIAANAEKEIELELERKIELANQKIARAESQAIENVRNEAVKAAVKETKKSVLGKLSKNKNRDKLLAESIKNIANDIK